MASFSAKLLERPAAEAAAIVALRYLDDAADAAARLRDGEDVEALHDFRVALRRLRVTVRAYAGVHEAIPKKQRARLRKLARATNAARDAEVQHAWLLAHARQLHVKDPATLERLRARLRRRRRKEIAQTREALLPVFRKTERKLRRRLEALQADAGAHEAPFRAVAAATLVRHAGELKTRLGAGTPPRAPDDVHATRIAAKRLRYLLEPLEAGLPEAGRLAQQLKRLQDTFGELTDAHELERALRGGGEAAAAAVTVLHNEVTELVGRLHDDSPSAGAKLERDIAAAARRLQPQLPTPPSLRQRSRRRRAARAT